MRNTYVFEVLETFSTEETEAFQLFLHSAFFNNSFHAEKIIALYELLVKARQDTAAVALEKTWVFRQIFPDSLPVEGKLDKLLTEFKKLLHTFLITRRYLNVHHEGEHLLDLAIELRNRGLEDKYRLALEKAQKFAGQTNQESLAIFRFQYDLSLEEHEWHSTYNKAKGDLQIPKVLNCLDRHYFAQRLEMLNRLLLQQKLTILPTAATDSIEESWNVPPRFLEASILIRITWKIHAILTAPAPTLDDFEQLLQLLQEHETQISPDHLREYYTYLRNLCTMLINTKNHVELRPALFQIYIDNLARGYFYYEGKIPSNAVLNITLTALAVQAVEWAKDFVEQHRDLIIGENDTCDFYRLNKALYLFAEKNYDAALEIIPFGSSYSFYHLAARRLELKIYYEMDSDLLPYKIDAFKMFISRAGNKILSKDQHELYANFINFVRQLSLSPKIRDKARSEQLTRRIQSKKLVAERSWLLEKARALGDRRY